jgi:hypothetical protein
MTMKAKTRIRMEVEDGMLTNVPRGEKRPPVGQWWEYILFGWWVNARGGRRRMIQTIKAPTKRECNAELRQMLARPDVKLLRKGARASR